MLEAGDLPGADGLIKSVLSGTAFANNRLLESGAV